MARTWFENWFGPSEETSKTEKEVRRRELRAKLPAIVESYELQGVFYETKFLDGFMVAEANDVMAIDVKEEDFCKIVEKKNPPEIGCQHLATHDEGANGYFFFSPEEGIFIRTYATPAGPAWQLLENYKNPVKETVREKIEKIKKYRLRGDAGR